MQEGPACMNRTNSMAVRGKWQAPANCYSMEVSNETTIERDVQSR
ncbi:hypothetical protein SAMN04488688_103158 [Paenibacillus sp. cl141a]|nr:hypothetical protein SAMN04488688_103158 [Paenibacillus sp. cl141a]